MIEEDAPCLRELNSSAIPSQELDADGALELQDLLGKARLGDVETFRRSPEMKFFGDGDEVPELTEIYTCHRSGPLPTVAVSRIMHTSCNLGQALVN